MANIINSSPQVPLPTTPTIYHLSMPLANIEYSYLLPPGSQNIYINNSTEGVVKFSWSLGTSGSMYISVNQGSFYFKEGHNLGGKTIYIQNTKPSQILQLETWA